MLITIRRDYQMPHATCTIKSLFNQSHSGDDDVPPESSVARAPLLAQSDWILTNATEDPRMRV
jgi:hypothetical protein